MMRACLLVLLAGAVGPSVAYAQDCPSPPRPFVALTADVAPPDQAIADALAEHLASELDARGIALCVGYEGDAVALAEVELRVERPGDGTVRATVRLGDRLTDKRVERTLDLTDMPADAHPLAVAVAADELLRASWAEVHLEDAPPTGVDVPREVLVALATTMRDPAEALAAFDLAHAEEEPDDPGEPPSDGSWEVGLLASGLVFERLTAFGGQLYGAYWPHDHIQLWVDLDVSFSLANTAPTGSVRAERQGGHVGGSVSFVPHHAMLGAQAELSIGLLRMAFVPEADEGVRAEPTDNLVVEARGGLRGWLLLGPVRLTLGVVAVVALRPATAVDDGETVLSNDRVGGEATLGAGLIL